MEINEEMYDNLLVAIHQFENRITANIFNREPNTSNKVFIMVTYHNQFPEENLCLFDSFFSILQILVNLFQ